jgi:hypothetical protein
MGGIAKTHTLIEGPAASQKIGKSSDLPPKSKIQRKKIRRNSLSPPGLASPLVNNAVAAFPFASGAPTFE